VLYYMKIIKFVKLENFNILADFVCYYIKVTKFIELEYIVILEDFSFTILH